MTAQRITLPIYNLGCGGGEAVGIEQALAQAPGVVYAYVNPLTEMAYVEFDPTRTTFIQLAAVIERSGYGPPHIARVSTQVARPQQLARHHQGTRQRVTLAGLAVALLYILSFIADQLFPDLFQLDRFWDWMLIGVSWLRPWSVPIGIVEAFLYGALLAWVVITIRSALSGRQGAS
jgi:cation transport ATPase